MTAAPPWPVGAQRAVLGVTFTLEAVQPLPHSSKAPHRWRAMPLAHDVYVLAPSATRGHPRQQLRVDGVLYTSGISTEELERVLSRCMHTAIKWRIAQINKWRRGVFEYDAALLQLHVGSVIATAQQVFPHYGGKTDDKT